MADMDFTEYDRITDTLMYLSDNLSLNFTVSLSRKSKTGERLFYQYESKYGSDKYGVPLRSIKRNMNFSFVLDCKNDFTSGILLRPQDVELLVRLIELRVLPWFLSENTSVFKVIDDKITIMQYEPVSYVQDNKYISFEPDIAIDRNELENRGIRITIQSGEFAIVPVDQFMGFYNILRNTDMYAVACSMCNYAKTKPYGINVFTSQGLGASPSGRNNNIDKAWKESFKNAFLDNSAEKDK